LLFARFYYLSIAWAAMPMLTSIDGGASFTPLGPDGFFASVLQGNIHDGLMVRHAGFGAGEGPQVSWDTGVTWTSLPEVPNPGFFRYPFQLSPDESHLFAYGRTGIQRMPLLGNVGVSECSAHVNSSGRAAKISAHGSSSLANNDLRLWVHDASRAQFCMFLVSRDAGFIANPGGSAGDLCLGGGIGRYNALALHSGAYGELYKSIDWNTVPSPTVPVVAQAGETWRFQCWFREGVSSQFSDAVAVTVLP